MGTVSSRRQLIVRPGAAQNGAQPRTAQASAWMYPAATTTPPLSPFWVSHWRHGAVVLNVVVNITFYRIKATEVMEIADITRAGRGAETRMTGPRSAFVLTTMLAAQSCFGDAALA